VEYLKKHRNLLLLFIDLAMVVLADTFTYLLLIIEYNSVGIGRKELLVISLINVVISVLVFCTFKIYSVIWRYARIRHLAQCFGAVLAAAVIGAAFNILSGYPDYIPTAVFFVRFTILVLMMIMSRIVYAILFSVYKRKIMQSSIGRSDKKRLMIVGAGEVASLFFDDLGKGIPDDYDVVCIVDDDDTKIGRKLCGVEIVGTTDDIPRIAAEEDIDNIIVCIAHTPEHDKKRIYQKCYETDCHISKMAVGVNDNVESKIRKINIDDLLGRETVNLDDSELKSFIGGKTVMVTGGGGSIGSELTRRIASLKPKKLIIVDNYENNAYDVQQELLSKYKDNINLVVEIASVCDKEKIDVIFERHKPEILYHAAAHKHVPLMENNPEEAVKNNVFGTYTVARAAAKHGVLKFVLVSTDKAVNPTNIMGATKRCCAMIVQSMNGLSVTEFVAVRFGNVLGSNGSVIPLFEKQIMKGGPVTVTHPEIIRYFMTIPEAVELLLAAGNMAKGGEIFVLDMGEPVKIADLARQIIRLAGLAPGRDIEIKYTGLRPGEKLYEELLMDEEGLKDTAHKKIFIGSPIDIDRDKFFAQLEELRPVAYANESERVLELVAEIVPTYVRKKENMSEKQNKVLA